MRGWVSLVALAAIACAQADDGVWLRVEQRGVFKGGAEREVQVSAAGQRVKIVDRAGGRTYYLDREARQVAEVDTRRSEVALKPFAAWSRFREERAARRKAQLERIREQREAADDDARAELDAKLRELGLRLDGEEHVSKERGVPQPRLLTLDAVSQPVLSTPTALRINQARDPVATLHVAPHLELPVQPLDVYLELGLLPEPLEVAVRELEGTVLGGELVLDDGSLKKRIRFRVLEVRRGVEVGDLRPPRGLTRVAQLGERAAPTKRGACTHCGESVGKERISLNGLPFCSRAHRHAYIKARAKTSKRNR